MKVFFIFPPCLSSSILRFPHPKNVFFFVVICYLAWENTRLKYTEDEREPSNKLSSFMIKASLDLFFGKDEDL